MQNRLIVFSLLGLIIVSCINKKSVNSNPKFQQYYVSGEVLYNKHCANCHQPDGSGLRRLYPPLNKSDYLENNIKDIACLMKHGINEKITVNGVDFNMEMKGNPLLTELEVAEILTYIYNAWELERGIIESTEVNFDECNK